MGLIKHITNELSKYTKSTSLRYEVKELLNRYTDIIQTKNIDTTNTCDNNQIFANNYLNFSNIKVIGFDLDYTLVTYTTELQELIYRMAKEVLINSYGYPEDLHHIDFDSKFAVRGLSVDVKRGILCKLSHLQRLSQKRTYKGKQHVSSQQMEQIYGEARHISHYNLAKMRPLHDLFCVPEACLIADTIGHFEKYSMHEYDAAAVIDDIQAAVREVHVSGSMQNVVVSQPDRYIKRSPHLADTLMHLRKSNKKLFLCTNSNYGYANKALRHVLGMNNMHTMPPQENLPFKDWRDLFDVVICSANKPEFYSSRRPFRRWITTVDRPDTTPVGKLHDGEVYVQGSAKTLHRATGWSGQDILYIGDNLLNDLVEARRSHGWRTSCVINELDEEITIINTIRAKELRFLRSSLRCLLFDIQIILRHNNDNNISNDEKELLNQLELQLQYINREFSSLFNNYFGSIFRTDGHPSYFAFMLLRYVDIYMSDVNHLLYYNSNYRFYPNHAIHMAHDPIPMVPNL